ncbi:MAG: GYD domain-containing protein [Lentisphaeria bacterium]|jgi:hypothetical protein|nr:GYD domain-containing protein [Lentisphaeria bacterium]
MATYISLINYTEKGVHAYKDTVHRTEQFRELATAAGVAVKEIYWTIGSQDGGVILEAPPDPGSFFATSVFPIIQAKCAMCHGGDAMPELPGNADGSYEALKPLIAAGDPDGSDLYQIVQGNGHMGGEVLAAGSEELETLRRWILLEK